MKKPELKYGISLVFTLIVLVELVSIVGISSLLTWILQKAFNVALDISPLVWAVTFSIAIGIAFTLLVNYKFFNPIKTLVKAMGKVANGDFDIHLDANTKIKEIQEIYDNFNLMVKELGATEILQTDFVSNVSHEIKTPVNSIEGYAMLLQDSSCTPEERTLYAEKILFNTRRLSDLVGNVLLLSKIENQVIKTKTEKFRLDEQIRQSIMLLERKWSDKELELDVDLEDVVYSGNAGLLIHVWNNLLDNAIKFNTYGGIITIRLKLSDDKVIFTIADVGQGIDAEAKNHIFDKFYQSDSSHRIGGNGLGLSIVKKIIDSCGGEILLESEISEGSKFTVILPTISDTKTATEENKE